MSCRSLGEFGHPRTLRLVRTQVGWCHGLPSINRTRQAPQVGDCRVVAFRRGAAFRDIVDQAFTGLGLLPRIALESSDLVTIRSLVAEGLGIALMPRSLAETPGKPITHLTVEPERLARSVALAWRTDHTLSPAAQALLAHLHQWLDEGRHPADLGYLA